MFTRSTCSFAERDLSSQVTRAVAISERAPSGGTDARHACARRAASSQTHAGMRLSSPIHAIHTWMLLQCQERTMAYLQQHGSSQQEAAQRYFSDILQTTLGA